MKKPKRTIRTINSFIITDWLWIGLLFLTGITGLRKSFSVSSLKQEENQIHHLKTELKSGNLTGSQRNTPSMPLQILGPAHKAVFISNSSDRQQVSLRWQFLPKDLRPQLEIKRFDSPEFPIYPILNASGAILNLPDGHYIWKVRSINKDNQLSDWSSPREFTIQENVRDAIPVLVSVEVNSEKQNKEQHFFQESEITKMKEISKEKVRRLAHVQLESKRLKLIAKKRKWMKYSYLKEKLHHQNLIRNKYHPITTAAKETLCQIMTEIQPTPSEHMHKFCHKTEK